MSSFIEFQAILLNKLTSIENRLTSIEKVLGIPQSENADNMLCETNEDIAGSQSFKNEINNFQNELADIKSLLSSSEN